MHLPTHLTPFLILLTLTTTTSAKAKPKNAILLSEIQSLTLRANAKTAHRRVAAIPQLKCISHPSVCALHEIDVLRCTNSGAGYSSEDIQWTCAASLLPELKLGSTDVICEGYSSSDDEYVLKGSCGVEYRLVLTDVGERKFPDLAKGGGTFGETNWSAWIFGIIFVAVLAWIVYSACVAAEDNRRNPARNRRGGGGGGGGGRWGPGFGPGGGGGGGGWFSDDDPPPPYPGSKPSSPTQGRWRPGFWSGLGAGTAAGYLAGNRGGNRYQSTQNYGSGWGSGSNSGWGAGPSRTSSGSSSTSAARHESTGFGGTSRR